MQGFVLLVLEVSRQCPGRQLGLQSRRRSWLHCFVVFVSVLAPPGPGGCSYFLFLFCRCCSVPVLCSCSHFMWCRLYLFSFFAGLIGSCNSAVIFIHIFTSLLCCVGCVSCRLQLAQSPSVCRLPLRHLCCCAALSSGCFVPIAALYFACFVCTAVWLVVQNGLLWNLACSFFSVFVEFARRLLHSKDFIAESGETTKECLTWEKVEDSLAVWRRGCRATIHLPQTCLTLFVSSIQYWSTFQKENKMPFSSRLYDLLPISLRNIAEVRVLFLHSSYREESRVLHFNGDAGLKFIFFIRLRETAGINNTSYLPSDIHTALILRNWSSGLNSRTWQGLFQMDSAFQPLPFIFQSLQKNVPESKRRKWASLHLLKVLTGPQPTAALLPLLAQLIAVTEGKKKQLIASI